MLTIQKFCKLTRQSLANDWDSVIAITGNEGSGKTTCELYIAEGIDPRFDYEKNVLYIPNATELVKRFNSLPPQSVLAIDEAVRTLHKYDWMTSIQQTIIKMYATERYQNKCTIALMPRFRDFTENFRNHRIKIWINVISRGIAVVKLRDPNPYVKDPWHLDESLAKTEKILRNKKTFQITPEDILKAERTCKNYFFDFEFPKLPADKWELYKKLREESRTHIDLVTELRQDKRLDNLRERLHKWQTVTYELLKTRGVISNVKEMEKLYGETADNIMKQVRAYREKKGLPTLGDLKSELAIDFKLPEIGDNMEDRGIIDLNNIKVSDNSSETNQLGGKNSK